MCNGSRKTKTHQPFFAEDKRIIIIYLLYYLLLISNYKKKINFRSIIIINYKKNN